METLLEVNSDQLRQETVDSAKQFKSSWIKLGQYLYAIHKDKLYKAWGYLSFETYCNKDLAIKQTTASKLLKSYLFLEREEPHVVKENEHDSHENANLPNYESVNLLRLAKNNEKLTEHDYGQLRKSVIDQGKEPKEVRQQVKQMVEENDDTDPSEKRENLRLTIIKRMTSFLGSARTELSREKLVPAYLLKQIDELKEKLEDQLQ